MIKNKISSPVTEFVTSPEITLIDNLPMSLFLQIANKAFRHKDLSFKLSQLWDILNDLCGSNPDNLVQCVINALKKIPEGITEIQINELRQLYLSKFGQTSKKVNSVTDFIFNHVKHDVEFNKKIDILTICGMLLSFVVNSQSHLNFFMENIKKAMDILNKKRDIEEVFSIESKVVQNTKFTTDIQAIRNAVSHASFDLKFDEVKKEYVVDFESVLTGFQFNKTYTGRQLFLLYVDYDKIRDIQEFLIRIAFLKASLRYFKPS